MPKMLCTSIRSFPFSRETDRNYVAQTSPSMRCMLSTRHGMVDWTSSMTRSSGGRRIEGKWMLGIVNVVVM